MGAAFDSVVFAAGDQICGAIGFLVGRFVYKRHHDPKLPGSPVHRADRLIPYIGFAGASVALKWPL
jgi:hypothetical protein